MESFIKQQQENSKINTKDELMRERLLITNKKEVPEVQFT